MNKFSKIIDKTFNQLNEAGEVNPTIVQAVQAIEKGLQRSPQVTGDPVAKGIRDEMFSNSDPNNPLHTAFEKLKKNVDNPQLSDDEHEALQKVAETLKTQKATTTPEETEKKTTSTPETTSTPATTTTSPNNNSYTYNPAGATP
jgi:hypothetical protein